MNIVQISAAYTKDPGGVARHVHDLVWNLVQHEDIFVHVITLAKEDGKIGLDEKGNIFEWKYPRKLIDNFNGRRVFQDEIVKDALIHLSDKNIDIIHAHDWDGLFIGWLLASAWDKPLVLTVHRAPTIWLQSRPLINTKDCFMESFRKTGALKNIVVPSAASRQVLLDQGFTNVTIIPHGVKPHLVSFSTIDQNFLDDHHIPGDRTIILCPVRADEHKRPDDLVKAAPEIIDNNKDKKLLFLFLSDWDEEDKDKLQQDLKDMAMRRNLKEGENVIFLPKVEYGSTLATLFNISSVVVIPSIHESFGQSVLDSFELRKPVVAKASMALTELINDGCNGLLFDSSEQLASQVTRLLTSESLREKLIGTAYKEFLTKYTVDRMVEDYLTYYTSLIK
jgi:glycosyltransferase involved in cell wall biosynthesis